MVLVYRARWHAVSRMTSGTQGGTHARSDVASVASVANMIGYRNAVCVIRYMISCLRIGATRYLRQHYEELSLVAYFSGYVRTSGTQPTLW